MTDAVEGGLIPRGPILIRPVDNGFIVSLAGLGGHFHSDVADRVYTDPASLGAFIAVHYGASQVPGVEMVLMPAEFAPFSLTADEKEALAALVKMKAELAPLADACAGVMADFLTLGKAVVADLGVDLPEAAEALKSMEELQKRLAAGKGG